MVASPSDLTSRPADWPADGPIDLRSADLPHASSTTEWWYVNSHVTTEDGRRFSLFASFFRIVADRDPVTAAPRYAHSVTWALVDADTNRYYADSRIDPRSPEIIRKVLEGDRWRGDRLIRRAMLELLERDQVPHPDRLITGPVIVDEDRLALDFGGNRFLKTEDGEYVLELFHDELGIGANLTLQPLIAPIRHGDNGVVRGVRDEEMFYYFIPRCRAVGTLRVDGQTMAIADGTGWYDHEFGLHNFLIDEGAAYDDIAWNWVAMRLDSGHAITAYDLFNSAGESRGRWAIVIDPDGTQRRYSDFTLRPMRTWTSTRTFNDYPTRWQFEIAQLDLSLSVEAAFANQEFLTVISKPAFWEGRVHVAGRLHGVATSGVGFVERSGFDEVEQIDKFFSAVGRHVRASVQGLLPLEPTRDQARRLIASEAHDHYLDGVNIDQYARTVIRPIRAIIDRGGKAWRSFALLACCDLVGGDSGAFADWLVVPELLHTGSLIVDDVQDESTIRRGAAACHILYGEPLAINAGTAAYFLAQLPLLGTALTPTDQLRIYELYFEALRAAHAGQAIDIDGHRSLMPQVIEHGDGETLARRVLAVHRLKSAVPARTLAMTGAIIGRGTEAQIGALGDFFERLGLAFQIIDDTLNLRGFKGDLKSHGEDIAQGKITFPIAKAMSLLPRAEREWLWNTLAAQPADPAVIASVVGLLEGCGALDACEQQARDLVETGWQRLDPLFRDSYVKIMLRVFGWYVLDRQY